ncbi:hypothetical protein STRZYGA_00410 [Brevundimonas phage vB_BpoS-Strzyga]|nr:hypothetical protein STRZYGA_00410 [Brevundimonas phage vB_BpoS-Strzyga]
MTATKTKPAAKAVPAKVPTTKIFSLAALARDLKVDPKVARAKARRNPDDFNKLRVKGDDHWNFPVAKREAVSRLLQA